MKHTVETAFKRDTPAGKLCPITSFIILFNLQSNKMLMKHNETPIQFVDTSDINISKAPYAIWNRRGDEGA